MNPVYVFKGEVETEDEIAVKVLTTAAKIANLFTDDPDIVKITFEMCNNIEGKMRIYCLNHLKATALRELLLAKYDYIFNEIIDIHDPSATTAEIMSVAFENNPSVDNDFLIEIMA